MAEPPISFDHTPVLTPNLVDTCAGVTTPATAPGSPDNPPANDSAQTYALNDARTVLGDMRGMLAILHNRQEQDQPEYRQLFDLYRRLSNTVKDAQRGQKT